MNNGFLSAQTLELMFTPHSREAPVMGYGLGWMVAMDPHFREVVFTSERGPVRPPLSPSFRKTGSPSLSSPTWAMSDFPGRLFGIVNPFLGDPSTYVLGGTFSLLVCGFIVMVRVRRRMNGAPSPS